MSNIQSPVVIEIDYSNRTFDQLKETIAPKHSKLIFDYPNVLLTRGVNGLYVYAVDEELQQALKKATR